MNVSYSLECEIVVCLKVLENGGLYSERYKTSFNLCTYIYIFWLV